MSSGLRHIRKVAAMPVDSAMTSDGQTACVALGRTNHVAAAGAASRPAPHAGPPPASAYPDRRKG